MCRTIYDIWKQHRRDVVRKAVKEKFTQDKELNGFLESLIKQGYTMMVEASPCDGIWGIGFSENDKPLEHIADWGDNLLGKIITDVSKELFIKNV